MHERDPELEVLTEALNRAVAGVGSAHLLEGPAGIGKTTVLAALIDAAGERGLLTLRVRGSELERSHPFGGARRLLASGATLVGDRSFHGPGAAARAVLEDLGPGRPSVQPEPAQARQLGLIAVIGSLCDEHGPLLVAADDAHLLDDPTIDLLTMLCLRLHELPLVLGVAARTGADDLRPPLARLASEGTVRRLVLAPLRPAGVASVLRDWLGPSLNAELVDASVEATGGNPWFVTALASELARAGPAAQSPAEVRALAPHAIAGTVDARVAAVPDGPALARAVVTLGDDAEPRHVAALAELPLERVLVVQDELAGADLLRPGELRFSHAIMREAVKTSVPAGRRALDHRRAARLLADEGLQPERVAAHLLDSEPAGEAWAVDQLVEAAAVARERGAPAHAVELLERAQAEAPGGARQPELLTRLGTAELEAGRAAAAAEHLTAALAAQDGPASVDMLRHLAQAQASDGRVDEAIETLEQALDGEGLSASGRAALTADLVVLGTLGPEVGARSRRRLEALTDVDDATPEGRLVLAARARVLTTQGDDLEGTIEVAERALGEGRLADESLVWVAWSYATYALITADRLDVAVREVDRSLEAAVGRASVGWYCTALMLRADALMRSVPSTERSPMPRRRSRPPSTTSCRHCPPRSPSWRAPRSSVVSRRRPSASSPSGRPTASCRTTSSSSPSSTSAAGCGSPAGERRRASRTCSSSARESGAGRRPTRVAIPGAWRRSAGCGDSAATWRPRRSRPARRRRRGAGLRGARAVSPSSRSGSPRRTGRRRSGASPRPRPSTSPPQRCFGWRR